jgi:M6 family metalloprotease-like protein
LNLSSRSASIGRILATIVALNLGSVAFAGATMPTPSGDLAPEVRSAFSAGLLGLPGRPAGPGTSAATTAQSVWRVPVIMVGFLDDSLDYTAQDFEVALFDSTGATPTGSVYDYYQWASGGRLQVTGEVVAVLQMAQTREWYAALGYGLNYSGTPNNTFGLVYDALFHSHASVDWSRYDQDRDGYVDMLWVIHAGPGAESTLDRNHFWSITSRMSGGWRAGSSFVTGQLLPGSINLYYRIDRFSILPEISGIRPGQRAEIGVYCHEFGHALGLPDLYDTSSLGGAANVGPGYWSLMATGGYGGNGSSPESPSHIGGWGARFLGWKNSVRPNQDTTITLSPLGSGGEIVEFWFQGQVNPEHFLLEMRDRSGFDRTLNAPGLIVTHVDEAAIGARLAANRVNAGPTPGLVLVEADGDGDLIAGRNRGDAYDPFPGLGGNTALAEDTNPSTATFEGGTTTIALRDIARTGSTVRFAMQVRSPGWQPPVTITPEGLEPAFSRTQGRTAVRDPHGTVHVVTSEEHLGRPQIVMRTRNLAGAWEPAEPVSATTAAAQDPSIALLPGGDVAVVWSDTRGSRARIWYRARLRGRWTDERVVGDAGGHNVSPAIAADASGHVHVTWLNTTDDRPSLWSVRFLYFAPFGTPRRLSESSELPGIPAIAVAPDGSGAVAWLEGASTPRRLWFRRFHPDSGFAPSLPLTPQPITDQTAFTLFHDPDGNLHTLWETAGYASRELHWQRRRPALPPWPADSSIETRGAFVTSIAGGADPGGGLHMAFESSPNGLPQVWYKRWRPGFGWDVSSTEVTPLATGGGARPALLASSTGNVTLIYTDFSGPGAVLMEAERRLDPVAPVDVPTASRPGAPRVLLAGPNPLRSGQPLAFRWPADSPGDAVEVFDVAGRRVAVVPFTGDGAVREARVDSETSAALRCGVYFARVRGGDGRARVAVLR